MRPIVLFVVRVQTCVSEYFVEVISIFIVWKGWKIFSKWKTTCQSKAPVGGSEISSQGHSLIRWWGDGGGRGVFFLRDGFGFRYHNCKQFIVENTVC